MQTISMRWIVVGVLMVGQAVLASESIIGEGAVRSNPADYPSTCFLKMTVSQFSDEIENGCSGTLIAPDQIVTAGHCFGKNFSFNQTKIDITCGGVRQPRVLRVQLPTAWVENADTGVSVPRVPNDVAVLTLARNSLQPTVPTAKSEASFFNDNGSLRAGLSCYLAGFGINPRRNKGILYTASLQGMAITYAGGAIKLAEVNEVPMKISAQPGDSGGSLICEDATHTKTLVGITVSIQYDTRHRNLLWNSFATPWVNGI